MDYCLAWDFSGIGSISAKLFGQVFLFCCVHDNVLTDKTQLFGGIFDFPFLTEPKSICFCCFCSMLMITAMVMSGWSVNLTTPFLSKHRLPKR